MNGCENILGLLNARIDGELTEAQRHALDAHLAECPACADELARMERVWDALEALGTVEPSAGLAEQVLKHAHRSRRLWRRWLVPASAAAVLLVAVGVGYWLEERGTGVPDIAGSGSSSTKTVASAANDAQATGDIETMEIVKNIDILENLEVLESLDTLVNMGEGVLLMPVENGDTSNGGEL